jgi:hypothetical protein
VIKTKCRLDPFLAQPIEGRHQILEAAILESAVMHAVVKGLRAIVGKPRHG